MSTATTTIRSSNHNHHYHHQRQASAGVGAQPVVMLLLVPDLRMVVMDVSGACHLLPGMRRNTDVCMLLSPGRALVPGK